MSSGRHVRLARRATIAAAIATAILVAACAGDTSTTNAAGDVILRDVGCRSCTILAESIAFLGHPDDTVGISQDNAPAMDSHGRFYVASLTGGSVIVFGSNGRVMTTFGKAGRGPGELAGVSEIYVGRGDTLFVVGAARVHVISPAHAHVREFSIDAGGGDGFRGTVLSDGRLLFPKGDRAFTIVDAQGNAAPQVTLQGLDSSIARCRDCGGRAFREAATPGSVWSGQENAYRIEHHDLSGKLLQRIVRDAAWFPAWGSGRGEEAADVIATLGKPRLWGVRQGSDGTVWTYITTLDDPRLVRKEISDINTPKEFSVLLSHMTTRLEAIDPARKQLLGGIKLRGIVLPLTGDYSAQLIVDESGDWAWKILRLSVARR